MGLARVDRPAVVLDEAPVAIASAAAGALCEGGRVGERTLVVSRFPAFCTRILPPGGISLGLQLPQLGLTRSRI